MVKLCQVSGNRLLVRNLTVDHIFRIQQSRNVQFLLSDPESVGVVIHDVDRIQGFVVEQIWPEMMYDGVKGQTVSEGCAQVSHVDVAVFGCHLAAPNLQGSQAFPLHGSHCVTIMDNLLFNSVKSFSSIFR